MNAPRLEIRLDLVRHNASTLVHRLRERGVSVTGVTKATLGSPDIAHALLQAGVTSIGESRIENIESLRRAGVTAPLTLIRSPMASQAARVVEHADASLNTELDVLAQLSSSAQRQGRDHAVVLMVELGDFREGILPGDLEGFVRETLSLPAITLRGIGTNLGCQNGVAPDDRNMAELSGLVTMLESKFGLNLDVVSGGNSANLEWALGGGEIGRINDLRLGESVLLGCEPLRRRPIEGLHTDAFTLVAEVIELKVKPSRPWGEINQTAFGPAPLPIDRGSIRRGIVALGRQDADPDGLTPPAGMNILGASSDHLVIDPGPIDLTVGDEVRFQLGYGALVRAMTSPFVARVMIN